MNDYLLQEDVGDYKFVLENSSGFILLETSTAPPSVIPAHNYHEVGLRHLPNTAYLSKRNPYRIGR